jgi:pimeloyl-ACP methyl ester carboxylesterase
VIARVVAVSLLAVLLGGPAAARGSGLRDAHPCPGVAGYTCSVLDVPLDHSGRRPGTLSLQVAAADNRDAPRGVLLVLAGGPGQSAVPLLGRGFVSRALSAEVSDYRIVVFDERGTGAGALRCDALQAAMGSSDLTPPPPVAVRSCAARLGSRRQFFGTDDVVADMESLRDALGARRWSLDGISYGTFVGERYALAYPARVAKLVLDSVVPQVGMTDLGVAEFHAVARVLRSVCGAACVRDLAAVVRRLHDGPQLLDALTFLSIADPTYAALFDVATILRDARAGSVGSLERLLTGVRGYQQASANELDQGLHASALCADWRYPWGDSAAPLATRAAKLRAAVARLRPADLYPFDAATALGNGFVGQCLPWAPAPPTPLARGKLTVPTLLVNGDRDLSTPLQWAREELRYAPRGRLVVVPGAGHSVQSRARSEVGRRAVAAFLLGK